MIFGAKSERFVADDSQLNLFETPNEVSNSKTEEVTYTRGKHNKEKNQPKRSELPAHLPRKEEIIEPQYIEEGSRRIGEEITEILEYNPANVYVRIIVRPKYAKAQNNGVLIAELPTLPLPKSNAGASMLAHISVSKFIDHLPFYRQSKIFKRQQLNIAEST